MSDVPGDVPEALAVSSKAPPPAKSKRQASNQQQSHAPMSSSLADNSAQNRPPAIVAHPGMHGVMVGGVPPQPMHVPMAYACDPMMNAGQHHQYMQRPLIIPQQHQFQQVNMHMHVPQIATVQPHHQVAPFVMPGSAGPTMFREPYQAMMSAQPVLHPTTGLHRPDGMGAVMHGGMPIVFNPMLPHVAQQAPMAMWTNPVMPPQIEAKNQSVEQQLRISSRPIQSTPQGESTPTSEKHKRRSSSSKKAEDSDDDSSEYSSSTSSSTTASKSVNRRSTSERGRSGTGRKAKRSRSLGGDSEDANLNGEQRLMIVFDSFGRLTARPQKMGRKQGFIPDGIRGTFSMYGEAWGFEIKHENVEQCEDGEERVCITWVITNKSSGLVHSMTETPSDAMKRDLRGVSLCNKVFVQAMELRAREYEAMVEKEKQSPVPNMLKISNHRSRAQSLRPQRFSEGPLLFGLRHKCVQNNMDTSTISSSSSTSAAQRTRAKE